jgi:hypothetical protein
MPPRPLAVCLVWLGRSWTNPRQSKVIQSSPKQSKVNENNLNIVLASDLIQLNRTCWELLGAAGSCGQKKLMKITMPTAKSALFWDTALANSAKVKNSGRRQSLCYVLIYDAHGGHASCLSQREIQLF